jgi:hypothetical protein
MLTKDLVAASLKPMLGTSLNMPRTINEDVKT